MTSLAGIHDIEANGDTPQGTWIVDTIALSESPQPRDYRQAANGLNVIVRANWGYGTTGTLPTVDRYGEYVDALARYVAGCHGCHRWIIGNEPNLSREWPEHQPILPHHYAACYMDARAAIHALDGHERDEVLVAGSGPWNAELKYPGNERGDWVTYTLDCLRPLGVNCDGVALHSYCHGYDPALASSGARMDAPFQDRYYNFLAFQDYLHAFPAILSGANFYITESNGNGPWQATGLIPAMLSEVDAWNQREAMKVKCLIAYRFPAYDEYFMQGKADVMAEYLSATHLYNTPSSFGKPEPPPSGGSGGDSGGDALPPRDIDPRLIARGVHLTPAIVTTGTSYWRVTKAEWLPDAAHQVGPDHHILGEVLLGGVESAGVPLRVTWPSGFTTVTSKADDPNASYNYDYAMSKSLNEYSIFVNDGAPSDSVAGIGMGQGGNPAAHTSTWITWEYVTQPAIEPIPPLPPLRTKLIWPVVGPVTQYFGDGGPQFGMPGHDGIDIACRQGTPVVAIADGEVVYIDEDRDYGLYCRIWHKQIYSYAFFAHLTSVDVYVGDMVEQGQTVAHSGNSGNSTGPHLHFELRGCDETGEYVNTTVGYPRGRYNPQDAYLVTGSPVEPA